MKKFCYLLLFFVAIVILLLPSVFAAGTTVAVSDTTAQPGDEVVLHVNITGNVGFGTGKYSLHYDPTILNLVQLDVTGTLLANGAVLNHEKGIISFSNINGVTQDGVLFNVKFMVAENAVDGDYEVSVTIKDVVNAETLIPVAIDTTINLFPTKLNRLFFINTALGIILTALKNTDTLNRIQILK